MGNIEFESLVPTNKMDENKKTFIEALKWATSNPDNKNIAITGTYGAGKSSLIETFIKEEKLENETVKISIATFNQETINDTPRQVESEVPIENILEQQILQQLFYKIEPNKIPLSQFTRFYDLDRLKTISTILFLLLMSILTYVILKFDWLTKAYKGLISGDLNKTILIALSGLLLIVIYSYFIYLGILIFQKMGLSKFGLGNTSIEVVTKENNTVFNRYLDEIIYFFKQSKYKYVIFEDLDRFDNIGIYERLKGLNIILNGTKQLSGHNIIFIYALKDDLFISNDGKDEIYNRTKFFDFIIPTIKVVHSSNAENLLLEKLKTELVTETNTTGINKELIEDISLFVNDMRTLINICNEYKIYKSALLNGGITSNNLFAFIVYKNIYPSDYSNLLNNQGKLYDFLNIKDDIVNNLTIEINDLKHKLSLGIISEEFNPQDIEWLFYQRTNRNFNSISVLNEKNEVVENISDTSGYRHTIKFHGLFEACLKYYEKGFKIRAYQSNGIPIEYGIDFFDDSDRLNFLERYKYVKYKEDEASFQEKMNLLINKLQKVKTKSISSLLEINLLDCSFLSEIKANDELLYFLVRHGWIDESYEDYLSYFYEGSLSNNDVKMLRSIRNDSQPDYSLALRNTRKVWEKIRIEDIQTPAIFNFDLFEQLLIEPSLYPEKLQKYLQFIFSIDIDQGIKFYLNYVEYLNQNGKYEKIHDLLSALEANGIDFISYVVEDLEINLKETYLYALINSWKNISYLLKESQVTTMKNMIDSMNPNQLFEYSNFEENSELLKELNIQFTDITSVENVVYKNILIEGHRFDINKRNLEFLMEKVNYKEASTNEKIGTYIVENKIKLFENVILSLQNYKEEEETFVQILNDSDIDEDLKLKLIEKCSIRIEHVEELDSIKNIILSDKVVCSLNNILIIVNHEEYSREDFNLDLLFNKQENINEFLLSISNSDITLHENLCNEIIKSNYINTDQLNEILRYSNGYIFISSDVLENINENSLNNIIEQIKFGKIYWSKKLYEFLYNSDVNKNILLKYLITSIECSPEELSLDLIKLNEEQELIWVEEVAEVLVIEQAHLESYFKQFSQEVSQEYFFSKIDSFIPIISDLNFCWLTTDMNITYFIKLVNQGVNEDFLRNQISKINIWDIKVFDVLRKNHDNYAINYAKKFEIELKSNVFTQEVFNVFVAETFNFEVIINLYNFNRLEPSTELLIWLLNEDNIQHLDKLYNKIYILNSYSKQENISKILHRYIKTKKLAKIDVYKLLSELKQPFSEVGIRRGDNKEVDYDTDTFTLFKYLEEKNIIASMNMTESNKIKFNNKRK